MSPAVPVKRFERICLLAMQVGVNPGARAPLMLLRRFIHLLPPVFGIPLQAGEGKAQIARRLLAHRRSEEFFQFHEE